MKNKKLKTSSFLQYLQIALLVVTVGLLVWSRPWNSTNETRQITVDGIGTVKAVPDSYQFMPSYDETGTDPTVLIDAMTAKANEVTDKLKELGVEEDDIALQSNAYDQKWLNTGESQIVSFSLTITVDDKELAQKVQNYLLTTSPQGAISPYPTFTEKKTKELQKQAREEAIKDARLKAETVAKDLGVEVGEVVNVIDGFSGGGVVPLTAEAVSSDLSARSLPILTGKQEVTSNVTVGFAIK